MTRKRINKVRDSEATKRELLDAVGEILREQGFSGLRTNAIARWIGKDKNLIRYHFQGLGDLKKAYIREKDYWLPFFERFLLGKDAGMAEVKDTFSGLMQENFRSFYENPEMQKIILWQISEDSPVMKRVSEERETAGELLLGPTDVLFRESDVNFRAVIALLLGGSYYISLHAHTNGSKVCGMEMNGAREREEVARTIDQVIGWACSYAGENQKKETEANDMVNKELNRLEQLAQEISERDAAGAAPDQNLMAEVNRLKELLLAHLMKLNNQTQINTFLKVNMGRLAGICDLLYDPNRAVNADAELVLALMESIRKPASDVIPGSIVLPKLFCVKEALKFGEQWKRIEGLLLARGTDILLTEIIGIPFFRFCKLEAKACWSDFRFLKRYGAILEESLVNGIVGDEPLIELLIGLGYNHSRFSAYYGRLLKSGTEGLSFEQKQKVLLVAKTRLFQVTVYTSMHFDPGKMPVETELGKWIDAELGSPVLEGLPLADDSVKLNRTQRVAELAYWEKLMYDHGLYNEANLDVFSEKVAQNFNAKDGRSFSGSSIKAKLYSKDRSVIAPIAKKLKEMLEDLDNFL